MTRVVERLRDFDLAKGELIMLINMRPQTPAQLHACIEEVEGRLGEAEQLQILDVVAEVLGHFPAAAEGDEAGGEGEGKDEGDEAMDVDAEA